MNEDHDDILLDPVMRPLVDTFSRHRGWYIALGVLLVLVGVVAITAPVLSTLMSVYMLGWLLLISGIAQMLGAFGSRRWGGFLVHMLSALLAVVVGVMALRHPGQADLALTMLIATFLLVGGMFRVLVSAAVRFRGWGWPLIGGVLSAVLGGYVYATLPVSSLWVLGTVIGVDMLSTGWTWIFLELAAREAMKLAAERRPSRRL